MPSFPPCFPCLLSFQCVNIYGNPQKTKSSRSLCILTSCLSNILALVASAQESDGRSLTEFSRAWADSASVNSGWKPAAAHEKVCRPKCRSTLKSTCMCPYGSRALPTFRHSLQLRFRILQLCTVTEEQLWRPEPFQPKKEGNWFLVKLEEKCLESFQTWKSPKCLTDENIWALCRKLQSWRWKNLSLPILFQEFWKLWAKLQCSCWRSRWLSKRFFKNDTIFRYRCKEICNLDCRIQLY